MNSNNTSNKNSQIDIASPVNISLALAHALCAWETLSCHFANLNDNPNLSDNDKKAIWGLTDLLEKTLIDHGINGNLDNYQTLVKQSQLHLQNHIKVDFLDN